MLNEPIRSAANAHFRALLALRRSAGDDEALLEGLHLVTACLDHGGIPAEVVVGEGELAVPETAAVLARLPAEVPVTVLADHLHARLSTLVTPAGILARFPVPRQVTDPRAAGPCVLLDGVQDPGNLGALLRSAAAAGMDEVYLAPPCARAWSPKVLRAGMGAHFGLRIHEDVDLAAFIAGYRGRVIASDQRGPVALYDTTLTGHVALLFGNEGAGLDPRLAAAAAAVVAIPMAGATESLNVAAAAAICLFERVRQQR